MMTIASHKNSKNSAKAVFHEFLTGYRKGSKVVYGFVEGDTDKPFYKNSIMHKIPQGFKEEVIVAGNRDRVIEIHSLCNKHENINKNGIVFFIDQDLHRLISNSLFSPQENIYVTDGYSIENMVITGYTFSRVIEEDLNIKTKTTKIQELFENKLEEFKRLLIPIMASIIHWRKENLQPRSSNLDEIIDLDIFFEIRDAKITQKIDNQQLIEHIHRAGKITLTASYERQIKEIASEFNLNEYYTHLTRGKFLVWFFTKFCNSIYKDWDNLDSEIKKESKKGKQQLSLSQKNALTQCSVRAQIPASLDNFLNATIVSYCNEVLARTTTEAT